MLIKKHRKRVMFIVAILMFSMLFQRFPVMAEQEADYESNAPSAESVKSDEDSQILGSDAEDKDEEAESDLQTGQQRNDEKTKTGQGGEISSETKSNDNSQNSVQENKKEILRGDPLPKTEIKITEFSLLTESYQVPNEYMVNRRYKLKLAWDASYYENNLKKGDFFVVNLPKAFIFPSNHSACNFDILAPDGTTVVAKAVVTPGPENAGGNVKVTFTEYVENKHNIKGTMFLAATFNQKEITVGQDNVLEI